MIKSFGDRKTPRLFADQVVKELEGFARRAKRKLEAVHAASRLEDLRVPPSNRLEKLKGDRKEFHSIRVNDQWRVVFRWTDGHAHDVAIVDYH
ncbi:MAG: type II toxin-antitoxin system RelE/ParE family toxin [Geminicoccales bacterium]